MSLAHRGRQLERAVARAERQYRAQGRCYLEHPATPTTIGRDGRLIYTAKVGLDFIGCHAGGRGLAMECKEADGASFAIDEKHFPLHQRETMKLLHQVGADVRLLVGFPAETYSIAWPELGAFLERPWRGSLSLLWCRAFGLLLTDDRSVGRRQCAFLDGAPHAGIVEAQARVEAERKASAPWVWPEDRDVADPFDPPEPPAKRTKEQIQADVMAACQVGIERQLNRRRAQRGRR